MLPRGQPISTLRVGTHPQSGRSKDISQLRLSLLLNSAMCYLKQKQPEKTLEVLGDLFDLVDERAGRAVGKNHWYHFGVGAPPILVYFSWDWDVHWGYGILIHGRITH